MPKPIINYDAAETFILLMMYDAYVRDQQMAFNVARVQHGLPIPLNVIRVGFARLVKAGYIAENGRYRTTSTGFVGNRMNEEWIGSGSYELTDEGRGYVEKFPDEFYDMSLLT